MTLESMPPPKRSPGPPQKTTRTRARVCVDLALARSGGLDPGLTARLQLRRHLGRPNEDGVDIRPWSNRW